MGQAAELGALADVLAGLVGLDGERVLRPGTASRLPLSAGTQKQWMTSRDVIVERDLLAGRDHEVVGGDDVVELAVVVDVVAVLPPPLLADDLDVHGVGLRLLARSKT